MFFVGLDSAKIEYSIFEDLSDGALVLQIPRLFINQAAFLSVRASNPISWITNARSAIGFQGIVSELSNLFLNNISRGESITTFATNEDNCHHHLNNTSNSDSKNGTIRLNYGNVFSKGVNISNCMAEFPHPGGIPLTYKLFEGNFMNNHNIYYFLMIKVDTNSFLRRWFIILTVILKITSSLIKLSIRETDCTIDYPPYKAKFSKKFFNLIFMSAGMSLAIPCALVLNKFKPNDLKVKVPFNMKLLIPIISMLDLFNTFFSNLSALNKGISLDSFELALNVIAIIIIQKVFMHKAMYTHMILATIALTCSIIVQITNDFLTNENKHVAVPNLVYLVLASLMKAIHAILCQYVLQNSDVDPELFIGFVGLVNLVIVLFIIYPIVSLIKKPFCHENLCTSFREFFSSKPLIFGYFVYFFNCFMYNVSINRVLLYTSALLWSIYLILSDGIKGIIDIISFLIKDFPLRKDIPDEHLNVKLICTSLNVFFLAIAILLFTETIRIPCVKYPEAEKYVVQINEINK